MQPFFAAVRPDEFAESKNATADATLSRGRPEVSRDDLVIRIAGARDVHLISVTDSFMLGH